MISLRNLVIAGAASAATIAGGVAWLRNQSGGTREAPPPAFKPCHNLEHEDQGMMLNLKVQA